MVPEWLREVREVREVGKLQLHSKDKDSKGKAELALPACTAAARQSRARLGEVTGHTAEVTHLDHWVGDELRLEQQCSTSTASTALNSVSTGELKMR